jgi:hypothetical protein
MRYEVLTAVRMAMLWVVTRRRLLVGRYGRFGETYCSSSALKINRPTTSTVLLPFVAKVGA